MSCDEMKLKLAVMTAKKRIRELWYQTGGACYLSFSGGKDSTVVLALIKQMMDEGTIPDGAIPAVYVDTRIELDAIVDFVHWVKDNWYSNVEIIKPEKSFGNVIREYGKPMLSKMRSRNINLIQKQRAKRIPLSSRRSFDYLVGITTSEHQVRLADKNLHFASEQFDIIASSKCCDILKKKPFKNYAIQNDVEGYLTGERANEGGARYRNYNQRLAEGKNVCTVIQGKITKKAPIIDWDDETLEAFIEKYDIPLSKAYTEYGMERTGCYLCPFKQKLAEELAITHQYEPKKYKAALGFLKDVYIAQGVELPFDDAYMAEFRKTFPKYEAMRAEMLRKYRPNSRLLKKYDATHAQVTFDEYIPTDEVGNTEER